VTRVELFEIIRRDHFVYEESVRAIARKHRVHRRIVRQALESAVPPARKRPERESPVLTLAIQGVIDDWLEADRQAPRKQRHTARRIHERLQREHGFEGAASTVRRYVGRRRRELGLKGDAFVPQDHEPGKECEVDWYEGYVDFPWGRDKVQVLASAAATAGGSSTSPIRGRRSRPSSKATYWPSRGSVGCSTRCGTTTCRRR